MKNLPCCGGIFDLDKKIERIQALTTKQEDPATWSDRGLSQKIGKEKNVRMLVLNSLKFLLPSMPLLLCLIKRMTGLKS